MRDLIAKEEVRNLFAKKIVPKLKNLEGEQSKVRSHLLIFYVLATPIGLYLGSHFFDVKNDLINLIGCTVVLLAAGTHFICKGFIKKFKSEVIRDVFTAILPGSIYSPEGCIPKDQFVQSNLTRSQFNRYSGEDMVKSRIGNIDLQFCELLVQQVTGSGKNRRTTTVFDGLFFSFKLPISLNQDTLILCDRAENVFGKNIGRFLQKSTAREGYELVQLESPLFEKQFVVYSSDQVKSRVLLKPMVLENLTSFKKKYGDSIDISIRGDRIYFAIKTSKNHFEPRIWGELVNLNDIHEIYDLVSLVRDLQDDLDLEKLVS